MALLVGVGLALALAVTASARPTTFAWDEGDNWPPGTTVELCGNGDVCLDGITDTQATLDLPVQPGDVIEGRARAIAPAGYQCGDPLVYCPYSDWATVAQTWPAPLIGGWARYEREVKPVAISIVQTATGLVNGGSSFNITFSNAPASGNKLLLFVNVATYLDANRTASVSGFSSDDRLVHFNNSMMILSKTATESESATYTVNVSGSSEIHSGIMLEISGANNSDFYNALALTGSNITLARTPTVVGVLPISAITYDNSLNPAAPSGWSGLITVNPNFHSTHSVNRALGTDTTTAYSATWETGDAPVSAIVLVNPAALSSLVLPAPASRFSHLLVR